MIDKEIKFLDGKSLNEEIYITDNDKIMLAKKCPYKLAASEFTSDHESQRVLRMYKPEFCEIK